MPAERRGSPSGPGPSSPPPACGRAERRGPGLDALTASELRVAELAAGGMTNRAIAQALFVTQRTVETHLGHVYQKVGHSSRERLREQLAQPG